MNDDEFDVLVRFKRRGAKPATGDFFTLATRSNGFVLGRVISAEVSMIAIPQLFLVYLYSGQVEAVPEAPVQRLPNSLLLPPMLVSRLLWTQGWAVQYGHAPLSAGEQLREHCFFSANFRRYVDEWGRPMAGPVPPVGQYGMTLPIGVDDHLRALFSWQS